MEIKSLSNTNFDAIFKAFNKAFSDYEIQLNYEQLQAMLKRRGFDSALSFAAFEDNEIVSFLLNGVGNYNGTLTAYDTGTGTLPDYRGQGLATKIFEYSVPYLKEANIKQYLLEVLQHNENAVSIYKKAGFEVVREFHYFTQKNNEIKKINFKPSHSELVSESPIIHEEMLKQVQHDIFLIKEINIEKYDFVSDFWDFHPSWQNCLESIKRVKDNFISIGIFIDEKLVGYCVFEPTSGDITQIAVDKQNRRKGIASLLLQEIIKLNKNDNIKVVNTDILCDSITNFLQSKNITPKGKQFEMIKIL